MSIFDDVRTALFFREDSSVEGRLLLTSEQIIETELEYFNQSVSITNQNQIPDNLKYQFIILQLG